MARPPKPPDERRSEALAMRLTPSERIRVEHGAHAAGLNASEYARALVLAGRVIVRQSRVLDHAVFDELRRIGVNLNQLTRLAHQLQQIPAGLAELCARLERILARELEDLPPEASSESAGDGSQGRG
jgi:Mobilization protein NikA